MKRMIDEKECVELIKENSTQLLKLSLRFSGGSPYRYLEAVIPSKLYTAGTDPMDNIAKAISVKFAGHAVLYVGYNEAHNFVVNYYDASENEIVSETIGTSSQSTLEAL